MSDSSVRIVRLFCIISDKSENSIWSEPMNIQWMGVGMRPVSYGRGLFLRVLYDDNEPMDCRGTKSTRTFYGLLAISRGFWYDVEGCRKIWEQRRSCFCILLYPLENTRPSSLKCRYCLVSHHILSTSVSAINLSTTECKYLYREASTSSSTDEPKS